MAADRGKVRLFLGLGARTDSRAPFEPQLSVDDDETGIRLLEVELTEHEFLRLITGANIRVAPTWLHEFDPEGNVRNDSEVREENRELKASLREILSYATRRKRASGLKRYLETDLEMIEIEAHKVLGKEG